LPASSLEDVWLVCRLHRFGRLKYDAAKSNLLLLSLSATASPSSTTTSSSSVVYHGPGLSSTDVRRPFAVAALALTDVLDNKPPNEHSINFFHPSHDDETLFPNLHQLIINDSRGDLKLFKAAGVRIHVRHFKGAWPLIQANNGPFFKRGLGLLSRPLSLQDDDSRNARHDFYVTLEEGSFSESKSVEVVVEGRTSEGHPISAMAAKSTVYTRLSTPHWNETFKVDLEKLKEVDHLYFVVRSVSQEGKFADVAWTFLKLHNPDGTYTSNGSKKLSLYRPITSTKPQDSLAYLKDSPKQTLKTDYLRISTQLVSSKYTQNGTPSTTIS